MWTRAVARDSPQQSSKEAETDATHALSDSEDNPQQPQSSPLSAWRRQLEAACASCSGVFSRLAAAEEGQAQDSKPQPQAASGERWQERAEIMRQGWLTCFKFAFQGLGLEFVTTCFAIMFVVILVSGIMDMTGRLGVSNISKHAMNAETMAALTQAELTLRTPIQLCVLMGRSDASERGDTQFNLFANDTSYDRLFNAIGDVLDNTGYESYTAISVSVNGTVIGVQRESSSDSPMLLAQQFGNGDCLDYYTFDENGLRDDLVTSDCSTHAPFTSTQWYSDFLSNDGLVGTGVYDWAGVPTLAIGSAHSQGEAVFVVLFNLRTIRKQFQESLASISKLTSSQYKLQALVTTQAGDVVLDTNTFPDLSQGLYTVDDILAEKNPGRVQQEMQRALRAFKSDFGVDNFEGITCDVLNTHGHSECYFSSHGPEDARKATMVGVTAFPDDIAESGIDWTVYVTGDRRHMITYYDDALLYETLLALFACLVMGGVFMYFWLKASHKATQHIQTFEIQKHAKESDVNTIRSLTRLLNWLTVKDGRANWTWLVYILCILGIALLSFNYWKQQIEEDVDDLGEQITTTVVNSLSTETTHTLALAASTLLLIQAEVLRKGYLAVLPDSSYVDSCNFEEQSSQTTCSVVPSVSAGLSTVRFFDDHYLALQRAGLDTDYVGATLDNFVTVLLHETEDDVRYASIADNTTIYNGIPRLANFPVSDDGMYDVSDDKVLLDQYKYWNGKEQEYFVVGADTSTGGLNWTSLHALLSLSADSQDQTLGVEAVLPFVETATGLPANASLGVAVVSLVIDLKSPTMFTNTLSHDLSKSIWTFITVRPETEDADQYVDNLVAASEGDVIADGVAVDAENSTSDTISRVAVELNARFKFDSKRAPSLQRFPDGTRTSEFDPILRVEYGYQASWSNVATIEQGAGLQWLSFCVLRIKPYYNVIERWQGFQLIFITLLFGVLFARFQSNRKKFYKTIPKEPLSAYALTPNFASSVVRHTQKRDIPGLIANIHRHAEQVKEKVEPDSSVGLMVAATVKSIAEPDSFQDQSNQLDLSTAASEPAVVELERQVSADSQTSDPSSASPVKGGIGGLARFRAAANAAKFMTKTQTAARRNKWEKFTIQVWDDVLRATKGLDALNIVETPGERARRYLIDAYNFPDRNVMKTLVEEQAGLASYIPEKYRGACPDWLKYLLSARTVYYIYTSHYYRLFCFAVILGHMALTFWEAPAFDDNAKDYYTEYGTRLFVLNGLCTFWHLFDVFLVLRIFGIVKYTDPVNSSGKRISKMIVLRCVLVLLMLVDYIQLCATEYVVHDFTLTHIKDTNAYEAKLLPWSAPLRGVLFIVRHHELQISMAAFFVSIVKGRDILVVAFCLLTLGVCLGIALLSGFYNSSNLALNFEDYRSAYIAMFTLIYTGENYPEALYPTFGYNRFFRAFFIIATFIGTFMLVAMIIASFERTYRGHLRFVQERNERGHRLAMFVAFVVLRQSQCDKDKLEDNSIPEDNMLKLEHFRHSAFYMECGAPSPDKFFTEIADEQIKKEELQAEQSWQHRRKASGNVNTFLQSSSLSVDDEKDNSDNATDQATPTRIPSLKPFVAASPSGSSVALESKKPAKQATKRLAWDIPDWKDEESSVLQFVSWLEYLVYNDLIKFGLVYQSDRLRERRRVWMEDEAAMALNTRRALGRLKSATKSMMSGISSRQMHVFEVESVKQTSEAWAKSLKAFDERARETATQLIQARYYNRTARAMVFLNIMCVLFLGTHLHRSIALRNVMHAFICFNIVETLLRVYARGFFNYMFKDHSNDIFLKPANQFDFVLIVISIILYLNIISTSYYKARGSDSPGYVGDIIFVIPTFRLVTILRTNRVVFFGLFTILRGIFPLLALLLVGIFIWAIIGVFLFCNLFEFMPTDEYPLTLANFNSVTDGMSTLFQVMTGESWDSILSMAMDTEYGYGAALYFITYVILVCTLFGPLFIGLIVDAYDVLLEELRRLEDENKTSKKHLAASASASFYESGRDSQEMDRETEGELPVNFVTDQQGEEESSPAINRLSIARLKRKQQGSGARDILGRQMSRMSFDTPTETRHNSS